MPDISMCEDNLCPSRLTCWRFTAKPFGLGQAYGEFERPPEVERCDYYWPVKGETEREVK